MRAAFAAALALWASAAMADGLDPRLAGPMVGVLQAVVALRDAEIKTIKEDMQKQLVEMAAKCGEPCKPQEPPPEVKK